MAFWKPFSKNIFMIFWSVEIRISSLTIYLDKNPDSDQLFWKVFWDFFFDSCMSKITPSPIPIKTGFWQGVFENDLQFVYKTNALTPMIFQWSKWDRCFSGKRRRRSFKICSSPIWMKMAFWGGVLEKDSQYIYRISTVEKTSSTYIHKNGVLSTLLKAMFTVCLQKTYLTNCPFT